MTNWETARVEIQRSLAYSDKYERICLRDAGETIYVKKGRGIAQAEFLQHKLNDYVKKVWDKKCRPLVDRIAENGGKAHCCPTHQYEPYQGNTWWCYNVRDKCIGFDWIQEPQIKINHDLGQAYYENGNIHSLVASRAYLAKNYFWHLMDRWLWSDKIRPQNHGDMMKVEINSRPYFFLAQHNRHGVLHWKTLTKEYGNLIEIKL